MNGLSVSIGVARNTIERIIRSRDRAVAVGYRQNVAVLVVGIAYRLLGGDIAGNFPIES